MTKSQMTWIRIRLFPIVPIHMHVILNNFLLCPCACVCVCVCGCVCVCVMYVHMFCASHSSVIEASLYLRTLNIFICRTAAVPPPRPPPLPSSHLPPLSPLAVS